MTRSFFRAFAGGFSAGLVGIACVACTACTTSTVTPSACAYGGRSFPSGTSFPSLDGCNTCSCQNGAIACTLRACADAGDGDAGDAGDR